MAVESRGQLPTEEVMRIGGGPIHQQLRPGDSDGQCGAVAEQRGHPGEQAIHRREEHRVPLGVHRTLLQSGRELDQEFRELAARRTRRTGFGGARLRHESLLPGWRCESTGESKKQAPQGQCLTYCCSIF